MSLIALTRPFRARALPGLLLVLFPIIEFFAMGYKMACASAAMRKIYDLPVWKNWKSLFIFGLGARLIQAIWLTPPAAMFAFIYLKLRVVQDLQTVLAAKNWLIMLVVLLIIAAIFAPASVLNYIAEAKFKAAFSFSMLKRMATKAYAVGWLTTGMYTLLLIAAFSGTLLLVSVYLTGLPKLAIGLVVMFIESFFFWFPGVTIWTLLGEAWGNALQQENY